MTEIEPTDSSTGRRRVFVRAIVAIQATIDAAVAGGFCHLDIDGASPVRGRRSRSGSVADDRGPRLDRDMDERFGPSPSDDVVPRQHIRIPAPPGLSFLERKDAGRMRKDQCVAFRLHL